MSVEVSVEIISEKLFSAIRVLDLDRFAINVIGSSGSIAFGVSAQDLIAGGIVGRSDNRMSILAG